jgi:hypothetical protein
MNEQEKTLLSIVAEAFFSRDQDLDSATNDVCKEVDDKGAEKIRSWVSIFKEADRFPEEAINQLLCSSNALHQDIGRVFLWAFERYKT